MKFNISVKVNEYTEQERLLVRADGCLPYPGAFWGAYSYCCGLQVNNGLEFTAMDNIMHYNLQVGKFNSLGEGLNVYLAETITINQSVPVRLSCCLIAEMFRREMISFVLTKRGVL